MTSSHTTTPLTVQFGPLTVSYDDRVLEPREWTTMQSRWAADLLVDLPEGPVLELCTGAGHIGLLALHLSPRDAVLVDVNPVACDFARANAAAADLEDRVEVREASVEEALQEGEEFVLAILDPPYVPSEAVEQFPEDPTIAIDGGVDGLDLARTCLTVAAGHLHPHGAVLLQLADPSQADVLGEWLAGPDSPDLAVMEIRCHDRGLVLLLRPTLDAR